MSTRKTFGLLVSGLAVAVIALLAIGAFVWRDDILRTWLDPKQPFQTYTPPPAPDYAKASAWALIPQNPDLWSSADPPADVFFVHPTTFDGGRDWNGPIGDRRADHILSEVMLPNYAGPFQRVGRVFVPRYRQASLYAFLTNKEDAQEARVFAYGDVKQAFTQFLRYSGGRPIVIVGVEQGGQLADHLVDEMTKADPALMNRIAAVYLIDSPVPADEHRPGAALPACAAPGEAQCVVAWDQAEDDADAARQRKRALVWTADGQLQNLGDRALLCVNPLFGASSNAPASAKLDIGATSATGLEWGVRPAFLPREVSAQCVNGFLLSSKPASATLKERGGWTDRLREAPFNLFYANEEADAKARVTSLIRRPGYVAPSPSSGASIEVRHAPIHRIP
jgi:hypothetical protein